MGLGDLFGKLFRREDGEMAKTKEEKIVEEKEKEIQKALKGEKKRVSYKIYRTSHIPGASGWVGNVDAVTLADWEGGIEEYLRSNFGGGQYVLKEVVDGRLTGEQISITIAGDPITRPTQQFPPQQAPSGAQPGPQQHFTHPFPVSYDAIMRENEELKRKVEELQKQLEEERRERERIEYDKKLEALKAELSSKQDSGGEIAKIIEALSKSGEGKNSGVDIANLLSSIMQSSTQLQQALFEGQRQMSDRMFEFMMMMMQGGGGREDALTNFLSALAQLITGRREEREGESRQLPPPQAGGLSGAEPVLSPSEALQTIADDIRRGEDPKAVVSEISSLLRFLSATGRPVPREISSINDIAGFVKRYAPSEDYANQVINLFTGGGGQGDEGQSQSQS